MSSFRFSFFQSLLLHGIIAACFLLLANKKDRLNFEKPIVIEINEIVNHKRSTLSNTRVVRSSQQDLEPKKNVKDEHEKVFGISESIASSNDTENEILYKDNNQNLPNPIDENLITKRPQIKSEIRIPYPTEARAKNIDGLVLLDILIDDKGKVRAASVIQGPGYGLNEAALNAIYNFEFSPAFVEKKPVAARIRYGYRFVLN